MNPLSLDARASADERDERDGLHSIVSFDVKVANEKVAIRPLSLPFVAGH
jgi:hypothetical protein